MSLWSEGFGDDDLPTAYGGCRCHCHTTPGIKHVMACCYPSDGEIMEHIEEELWEVEKEKE